MKPLMMLLITSELLLGCQSIQRPNAWMGGVNASKKEFRAYNLRTDFDVDGNRLPEAKPKISYLTGLKDLNGYICVDPNSFEELKRYVGELRLWARDNCNGD